ncbi:MAG: pyruvate kinase alpha/beta domain-containing protein, partial [Planctomycetota bacterium]|jgi:pyruvate kinase
VAVADGTDAVMLSGETATGVDPVNVVRTMATILREAENHLADLQSVETEANTSSPLEALIIGATLAQSSATMIIDFDGSEVASLSKRDRGKRAILVTDSMRTARQSSLCHSVFPVLVEPNPDFKAVVHSALAHARDLGIFKDGDLVTVIAGRGQNREFQRLGSLHLIQA